MMIRNYLPQTLMGRSIMILVVPVILAQVFAVTLFWDNHWDKVTRRLANSVAGEIAIIADQIENNYSDDLVTILSDYMADHLRVDIDFQYQKQNVDAATAQILYGFYGEILLAPLKSALESKLDAPHNIFIDWETEEVTVQVQLDNGFLRVTVPEQRLFSSSGYVFIGLLVISTFSLLAISVLFLRNQIRPIRRLAAAASLMGKGRLISLGAPRGAREVRQAWEAFETMQRRLRRQIEQRTAMLAGVSHDLRTPLTRVKLGLSMMDDQKEAMQMIADLDEMEKMVDAYLEFARGEKLEDAVEVNLKDFMTDIISHYQTEKTHITFVTEGIEPIMPLQKVNFRRCIENILSNAVRYATEIKVSLKMTEDRLFLTIEDNGEGIAQSQYEEVFKPFVRLDTSRSIHTGGAGLGLSVAMDIILAHGGKISLGQSKELGGLLVNIRLPV